MPGIVFALSLAALAVGGFLYSRKVSRWLGVDDSRPTPAVSQADGRDYVATPTGVVFAHHFASIAGAGPILGPVFALAFGWGPAVLWIVGGCVLFGAVHDFGALYVSTRVGGRSLATVARDTLGKPAFALTIVYTILMLVLVNATFLNISAGALTSMLPAADLGVGTDPWPLRIVLDDGVKKAVIGGIASTSVIVISLLAPVVGWLYLKKKIAVWKCSLLALAITVVSVTVGLFLPVSLDPNVWKGVLSVYVLVAAGIPVWILLQPRDFVNVHLLYIGLGLLSLVMIVLPFTGAAFQIEGWTLSQGAAAAEGAAWPMLFVLIACGAISGFHSLCAGGTTCKQIGLESDARRIGYFGMILEGVLALAVTIAVAVGLSSTSYMGIMYTAGVKANPNLVFASALGATANRALGLPTIVGALFAMLLLEGFVVTTLDTSVRLNRYLFEELWGTVFKKPPKFLGHYWVNSALAVALMISFSYVGRLKDVWKVFGSGNQLLAAMGLCFVAVWLATKGRKWLFAVVPAAFMVVTTLAALYIAFAAHWGRGEFLVAASAAAVAGLGGAVIAIAAAKLVRGVAAEPAPAAGVTEPEKADKTD